MTGIDTESTGFKAMMAELDPHWTAISEHFLAEKARMDVLMAKGHDLIGRVLKCHLIAEHYVERHLIEGFGLSISAARLTFAQKVALLPDQRSPAALVKPGLKKLNDIRNKFSHRLDYEIPEAGMEPIDQILFVRDPSAKNFPAIDRIEQFTVTSSTFLLVQPKEIRDIFSRAFSKLVP